MKKVILLVAILLSAGGLLYWWKGFGGQEQANPFVPKKELPYLKYTFENLASREYKPGKIEIGREITKGDKYFAHMFYYQSGGRRVSGQINIPFDSAQGLRPVIVMARGYVDKEAYQTGVGTKNAAAYYAANGYITLAPDFSGYGESDQEDENAIGARLFKPVEILDLLASLPSLPQADLSQVYLWGHSNGGQIMLSVAEILGRSSLQGVTLPAQAGLKVRGVTLWAPVSKPFPYNVLYYSDEVDDKGKWLRAQIAEFEKNYDVFNYSIDRYWDWIAMPIQIHQGTADPSVPKAWSDELVKTLKEKGKTVTYQVYPGADHNLQPAWNTVVARDLQWFDTLK